MKIQVDCWNCKVKPTQLWRLLVPYTGRIQPDLTLLWDVLLAKHSLPQHRYTFFCIRLNNIQTKINLLKVKIYIIGIGKCGCQDKIPFKWRVMFQLMIESQTLKIWLWNDLHPIYDFTFIIISLDTRLNWCPGSKISIFHCVTLTLARWPCTQTWPGYCQDASSHKRGKFFVKFFKSCSPNRHTDRQYENITYLDEWYL